MSPSANRMLLIDALKALAALLILFNHYSCYGPMSETVWNLFPAGFEWFYEYSNMAVQVFLVIAGFLTARALSPEGNALTNSLLPLIWKRYARLAVPYLTAISLAMVAAAIAGHWMVDESIPARATFTQWLAHVFLLQNILGFDALSAGVWYIAIDFQLFALTAILLWLGRTRFLAPTLVLAVAAASLFWFNRDENWDNWAIYFYGSYGLGAAAWWASNRKHGAAWLRFISIVTVAALAVDFRERIAIALVIALTLGFSRRSDLLERWPDVKPLAFLGQISYSIFLVHYPVLLLANVLYVNLGLSSGGSAIAGLLLAFIASIATATLFYRWIESPVANQRITSAIVSLFKKALGLAQRVPVLSSLLAHWV